MQAFIRLNRGLLQLPLWVRIWMAFLVAFNLLIPLLFFPGHLEAQLAVAAVMGSLILMTVLTHLVGFSRLLGLGHIFWVPLLVFLWTRLDLLPIDDAIGLWARALIVINLAALAFDAMDVFRYAKGERAEMVGGL